MGIRICSDKDAALLYESSEMRPVPLAAFDSREDAEAFLAFAAEREAGNLATAPISLLELLRMAWEKRRRATATTEGDTAR